MPSKHLALTPIPRRSRKPHIVIKRAIQLLSDERRWTQNTEARDKRGHEIDFNDPKAVTFCAVGAINRLSTNGMVASEAIKMADAQTDDNDIIDVNDNIGREAVLQAFCDVLREESRRG